MLDPRIVTQLNELLVAARAGGDPQPTAMTLATAGSDGCVSARIVLLKGVDERGLRFFTNYTSHKATQLNANPRAALCLHWKCLGSTAAGGAQVRAQGVVERLPAVESDAYFASRERGSQIGAWASLQSQPLPSRAAFDARCARYESEFAGREVPRPAHWGGYVLKPDRVEFWHGREHRAHQRVDWTPDDDGAWTAELLYP